MEHDIQWVIYEIPDLTPTIIFYQDDATERSNPDSEATSEGGDNSNYTKLSLDM